MLWIRCKHWWCEYYRKEIKNFCTAAWLTRGLKCANDFRSVKDFHWTIWNVCDGKCKHSWHATLAHFERRQAWKCDLQYSRRPLDGNGSQVNKLKACSVCYDCSWQLASPAEIVKHVDNFPHKMSVVLSSWAENKLKSVKIQILVNKASVSVNSGGLLPL